MGELAKAPMFDNAEQNKAPLQLYSEAAPMAEIQAVPWPTTDLGLEHRQQNIFGSELLPTNRDARLRTIVNALVETVPRALPEGPLTEPAPESRRKMDKYLSYKVDFPDGEELDGRPKNKPVRRDELIWFGMVREELTNTLETNNHPILQALLQVHALNRQRVEGNKLRRDKLPVLTDAQMDETADDLLKVTLSESIKDYFDRAIRHLRAEAKVGLDIGL